MAYHKMSLEDARNMLEEKRISDLTQFFLHCLISLIIGKIGHMLYISSMS